MKNLLSWLLAEEAGLKLIWAVVIYFIAMLGAMLMYLFASSRGLESTVPRLRQLLPGKSDTFYYRMDFCLVILIGSAVGYIFFEPKQSIQALAAGCGWVGALNVLLQQKPREQTSLTDKPDTPMPGSRP